jgi:hypothetical protein
MSGGQFDITAPLRSPSLWAAAFVKAQAAMPNPTKDARADIQTKGGAKFSYSYLTLDKMLEAVKPALNSNGLALLQPVVLVDGKARVETIIVHESGEQRSWQMPIFADGGASPQDFGSALTYAKRYHLGGILGVAIEEDSDGAQLAAPAPTGTASGAPPATSEPPLASQEQHAKLAVEVAELQELQPTGDGIPTWEDETRRWALEVKGKPSRKDLTKAEMSELIGLVQEWKLPFLKAGPA